MSDNFVDEMIEWSIDLSKSFLNNWDNNTDWNENNPMPAFIITFSVEEGDIQSLSPDMPYFLDFEDGEMTHLKYSKKDWGRIIRNLLNERKPLAYMVICETAYQSKNLKTNEKIKGNGIVGLFVTLDNFSKVFLADIERGEDGDLNIVRSKEDLLEGVKMPLFFQDLIHYDLGVNPILQ